MCLSEATIWNILGRELEIYVFILNWEGSFYQTQTKIRREKNTELRILNTQKTTDCLPLTSKRNTGFFLSSISLNFYILTFQKLSINLLYFTESNGW